MNTIPKAATARNAGIISVITALAGGNVFRIRLFVRTAPNGWRGTMAELKPCPFCGNDDQDFMVIPYEKISSSLLVKYVQYAHCLKCLSRGPIKRSEKEAVDAWNTRKT